MAEELIDKVVEHKKFRHAGPCQTKTIKLMGGEGYHDLLHARPTVGKLVGLREAHCSPWWGAHAPRPTPCVLTVRACVCSQVQLVQKYGISTEMVPRRVHKYCRFQDVI